ncbi:uncharacterized protein FMAN_11761 [Fusarium mangiferae]|uniref:Uncharacterized protein n=1 Tax=Fusarium mangiferae TaxID=192010 RepID=A0A1L7UNT8_FUSMA|nr:uncharacterized protein FMAN_11761 [Fusarium mangiferae]
MSKRSRNAAL